MLCVLFDKTVDDVLFRLAFFFGSIETPKLAVLAKKRNNRKKYFVSDSAETSFGSSFGCFEAKLVSLDTLVGMSRIIQYVPPRGQDSASRLVADTERPIV